MRALLVIMIILTGCASCSWQKTATKTMTGLHESLKGVSAVGEKHYGEQCVKLAKQCTAKPCKPATDCLSELKKFNRLVLGIRTGLHLGQAAVALDDKETTNKVLLKAASMFSEIKSMLLKSGVMP